MKSFAILITLLSILCTPMIASAHGGPARLELNVTQAPPGGTIEVRGINLTPDAQIEITLTGPGVSLPLGEAASEGHGDFTQVIALLQNLPIGEYTVEANDSQQMVSVPLTIVAESNDEEGEQRALEEPLLAPLPNQPKAQASDPPQSTVSFKETTIASKQEASLTWLPLVAMLGTIAIGAVMVAKQRQRRVERRR